MNNFTSSLPEKYQKRIKEGNLMISISGIRAKLPQGLSLEMLYEIILAFIHITGKKIIIGNDGRSSSPILSSFIESILNYYNKIVFNVGIAPTPTIKASCSFIKADAGIIITASHNPQEWNGLKFLKNDGYFYEYEDYQKLFQFLGQGFELKELDYNQTQIYNGIEKHIESILTKIPNIKEIQKKKYTVVIDPVNSSGIYAVPELLKKLNCKIIPLHSEPSKKFQRPPEPTPKSLSNFSKVLKKEKASIGFALDPDGDRLVCGSPTKGAINEEYTLGLAYYGKKLQLSKKSNFVVNFSTSNLLENLSMVDGHKVVRAPVGEANVLKKMLSLKAVYGGEGNGGVIDPSIPSKGRDSLTGIAYILSAMAERKATSIDDLLKDMPEIYMEKLKFSYDFEKKEHILKQWFDFLTSMSGKTVKEVNEEDGYFISFTDESWIHLRLSNTEPIIRLILEANTKKDLLSMKESISSIQSKIK